MIKIAKLICKSAYIKSLDHVFNTLEYAGNKINRQEAIFNDGIILEEDGCTKIDLSKEQLDNISSVKLYYKDGGNREIDWSTYSKLVSNKEEKITVAKLETVEDEIPGEFELEWAQTENKEYHNLKDLDVDKYLGYIANRHGAVKEDGHGLFGINGNISNEEAKAMAEEHQDSIIWTHIISIRGDDGDKTGFNNRTAWRNLIRAKSSHLARIYRISLENLVVNAAYHQNTDNDHVHVIMYSKDKREGFIKGGKDGMKRATQKMKSLFLNDIFKGDVAPLKELITQQRKDIKHELKNHLVNISKSDVIDEKMLNQFISLSEGLSHHKGKCDYGYLKPELKIKVNNFLRYIIDSNENISALFTELMSSKRTYIEMYNQDKSKIENLVEESREKIFNPSKGQATLQNIIIHSVENYNKNKATFIEIGLTDEATKEIKSVIKKYMDNSITDYSYSSQFLKQEFLKDKDNTKDILLCLYAQTDIKPIIDKWAENVIKSSGVQDITKYYEQFQLFLHDEPCKFEKLFNYNKLTNYIRYYKDNYVEQAYSQIKKSMKPEIPKKQIFKLLNDSLSESPDEWKELYSICTNIKEAETGEETNDIKQEQKHLISKIGQETIYEDQEFSKYLDSMNESFRKYSDNNNISLTLENRFLSDIYSGD